jgi:hypothetical protein
MLNLLLRRATLVVGDRDTIRLAGGLVGWGDVQDTVGVDVEGDFNLRNTMRSGRNAKEVKLTEQVVVPLLLRL